MNAPLVRTPPEKAERAGSLELWQFFCFLNAISNDENSVKKKIYGNILYFAWSVQEALDAKKMRKCKFLLDQIS
ncbi:hypothetical protein CSA56_01690 [candidate division KSB3 bacterium]|uniref:Uncharacterized protein n=1 Tax=candidate division KSB3 bacterium TaxID=2044937 RepID=A0A2G6KK38_9BACT|nr:MAG: hypothetical protein CSA56_01690 [candidate division KSB3 bacterium]